MNKEELQQLANIYNTLLSVHTCGEDTFIMTDCMRALSNYIMTKQKELQEENKEE